jgi:hypothetical protein
MDIATSGPGIMRGVIAQHTIEDDQQHFTSKAQAGDGRGGLDKKVRPA